MRMIHGSGQKGGKFRTAEFARGHGELPVAMLAGPGDVAVDFNIERWVGHDRRGQFGRDQGSPARLKERVAAKQKMVAELPELAGRDDRRPFAHGYVGFIGFAAVEILNTKLDLDLGETSRFDVKVQVKFVKI